MGNNADTGIERLKALAEIKKSENEKHFWDRSSVPQMHGSKISRTGGGGNFFTENYQKVFSHHTVSHYSGEKGTPKDVEELHSQDSITNLFLNSYYRYPDLYEGVILDEAEKITFPAFLEQILPSVYEMQPKASCLVGNIGFGKSTFFSALLVKCQRRRKKGPPRRRKKGPLGGCELVPVVHGRAPRATRRALDRLTRRRARVGPVGPRGQAWAGWSVQLAVGV